MNKQFKTVDENLIPDDISGENDLNLTTTDERYKINLSEIYIGKFASGEGNEIVEGILGEWETNEAGDTLTKYLGTSKNIVIPNMYNGKKITTIGANIFAGSEIETLEISRGIEIIEARAFVSSKKLTGNLTIPNSIKTIGNAAFAACTFDQKLTISESVETVENNAFAMVPFNNIEINMSNIPPDILSATSSVSTATGNLVLGENVKTIAENAFNGCTTLNGTLTIGSNVITIGNKAFNNCKNLQGYLNIPDSVITIGEDAFYDCIGFTGIPYVSKNVENIGKEAFANCQNLTGNLVLGAALKNIGIYAFQYCRGFESITVPSSVENVGNNAFSDVAHVYYDGALNTSYWGAQNVSKTTE